MRVAVLSMDVEDWYHLDYFRGLACDPSRSLLDGVAVYREILARHGIHSSFFVLGELVQRLGTFLKELAGEGHDLGVHGWGHTRPLTMEPAEFSHDLRRSKGVLEDAIGMPASGYRAPCFSLDRQRLDLVQAAGFGYDSSRILFADHPLYGTLDLHDYSQLSASIFCKNTFFEFQVSTLALLGRNIPVSGGGYIRLFPWLLMQRLIQSYLRSGGLYVLYIHPFELSPRPSPPLPPGTGAPTRMRFGLGRSSVPHKLRSLIRLLASNGYRFTTFAALREELLRQPGQADSRE
jgi:polysaccharide deacetylase family protein (PEP-CTERM system associated)